MSTQKSGAHLDPIIPSPAHCQREARLADNLETVLADAGMTPSQATDVVRQMAARCVTATAKLANERSTYERLLREHGNGDGRITKEINKSVRVGKEWLWLHAPPKKHSKHWESPLYFPLSTEVTAHHINATMDDNECFDLALKSFQTRINKRYFAKLRALYYASKGVTGAKDDDDMLDRAYCMLARYEVTPQPLLYTTIFVTL
jgi:hypothetical protein